MAHWKFFGKSLAFVTLSAALISAAPASPAQVSVDIGVAPVCPYGYYDYAPYNCAPYGYYGPDWFVGGLFIGAGPWYHGRAGFYGHVDNRYDPRFGYHGPFPDRGEHAFNHFHPNAAIDAHGHFGNAGHDPGGEHAAGFAGHGGGGHGGGGRH